MPSSRSTRPLIKDPVRYKTTMCANYEKGIPCPYDFKCQFAHGKDDLRVRAKTTPKEQRAATQEQKTAVPRRGRIGFYVEEIFSSRKHISSPPKTAEAPTDVTPTCSPCSSGRETPDPFKCAPSPVPPRTPPGMLSKPPGVLSTPPGLGVTTPAASPALLAVPKALCPIDFVAQGGAAARFAASSPGFVPDDVRALWPEAESTECTSPLRCNRKTGKVEPNTPSVPWVVRKMSSAGDLVRRAVSFVLENDDSMRPARSDSLRLMRSKRTAGRSERFTGESFDESSLTSLMNMNSLGATMPATATPTVTRTATASPYPEWA